MKKLFSAFFIMIITFPVIAQEVCSNYSPVASPDGNYLYFSSNRMDGTFFIYRSNINGTNVERLTSGYLPEYFPKLNADGTKLVYQQNSAGSTAEIFIINTDGTNQTRLTDNSIHDGKPSFSPDGTKIVFESWDEPETKEEIFIMNVDGTGRAQLTNVEGLERQTGPVFNPSGTKIYFRQGINANSHIISMDPDGSNWQDITNPNEFGYDDMYLSFNPEGTRLLFTTTEWNGHDGPFDIVSCNPDGSDWQRLTMSTDGDGSSYSACYSADGSKIFYGSDKLNDEFIWDIFSMDSDGFNKMMVVSCSNSGINPPESNTKLLTCIPNPIVNEGFITINITDPKNVSFTATDLSGRTVSFDYSITNEGILIRRGNLHPGMYMFRIGIGSGQYATGKLIIR